MWVFCSLRKPQFRTMKNRLKGKSMKERWCCIKLIFCVSEFMCAHITSRIMHVSPDFIAINFSFMGCAIIALVLLYLLRELRNIFFYLSLLLLLLFVFKDLKSCAKPKWHPHKTSSEVPFFTSSKCAFWELKIRNNKNFFRLVCQWVCVCGIASSFLHVHLMWVSKRLHEFRFEYIPIKLPNKMLLLYLNLASTFILLLSHSMLFWKNNYPIK